MKAMKPTVENPGGDVRVVDSTVFTASKAIAGALIRIKPGSMRELHWHPNASEWQYWIGGKGRMTVFASSGKSRTMDFNANDVGYVPAVAGHYIENTGTEDVVFLEMFRTSNFADISLNQWIRRLPPQMAKAHLNLSTSDRDQIPNRKNEVLAK
jgi:oxalate decarboxylase